MKYRSEIDGLRSFAVIPVVLYHAGITTISGGFVGVDVFFVISGYLIANIIISEMKAGNFTYFEFYERRVRRILPALATVVLFSIIASLIFALPSQVEQTAWSGIFALLGVSNIYFWTQSGYFAPASEFQMLLHTWSLGVEEQFYLLLPIALLYKFRLRLDLRVVMMVVLPILFAMGVWLSLNKPSVAFFLLPARAWELALGVALAVGVLPRLNNCQARSVVAFLGLASIVISIFFIDSRMIFPGWAALLPCLGAAAVIYAASSDNLVGRFLSLPPLRFIGLISYSLYLWHWPIFVSLRMFSAQPQLSVSLAVFGSALSVLFAYLTWRFVENPFRSRQVMRFRTFLYGAGLASFFSIAISILTISSSGLPNRLNPTAQKFASAAQDIDQFRSQCSGIRDINDQECFFGDPSAEPSFIVVGDSHAGAIRPAIEKWAIATGRSGTILWRGGCPLVVGATLIPDIDSEECSAFKEYSVEAIRANANFELVIVAGRWEAAYTGIAPEVGGSHRTFWVDDIEPQTSPDVSLEVFERGLLRTAQIFSEADRTVVFVGAVPEVGFDVPTVLALAAHNQGTTSSLDLSRESVVAVELDNLFEGIAASVKRVQYVSIWENICDARCNLLINGVPLYSDEDHLTYTAARDFMGPVLTSELPDVVSSRK